MKSIEQAITGAQYSRCYASNPGSTPESALEQFYAAFNGRDLALMVDNWAQTEEIALDNPLGGIRRGWTEISPLYERVFCGPAVVYVEFYDYTLHMGTNCSTSWSASGAITAVATASWHWPSAPAAYQTIRRPLATSASPRFDRRSSTAGTLPVGSVLNPVATS